MSSGRNRESTLVITSIFPQKNLNKISQGCSANNINFIVIGDEKTPENFELSFGEFWSVCEQKKAGFFLTNKLPLNHYSRKNIGYLLAIKNGSSLILDSDDDNLPLDDFWKERSKFKKVPLIKKNGWINIYNFFSDEFIWPRGFPLELIQYDYSFEHDLLPESEIICPIQQGLVDHNPDVDAVYRLTRKLPINFKQNIDIALSERTWSPFNSQNTIWFHEAFPLLYLPSTCSMRLTDIWRSFIAQRIAWENNWKINFYSPTVWQDRNEHNLIHDLVAEVDGYNSNIKFVRTLESLSLQRGEKHLFENLTRCYEELVRVNIFQESELELLNAWELDFKSCF